MGIFLKEDKNKHVFKIQDMVYDEPGKVIGDKGFLCLLCYKNL